VQKTTYTTLYIKNYSEIFFFIFLLSIIFAYLPYKRDKEKRINKLEKKSLHKVCTGLHRVLQICTKFNQNDNNL